MDEIVRIGCRFVSQERKGQVSQHIDQMEKKRKERKVLMNIARTGNKTSVKAKTENS